MKWQVGNVVLWDAACFAVARYKRSCWMAWKTKSQSLLECFRWEWWSTLLHHPGTVILYFTTKRHGFLTSMKCCRVLASFASHLLLAPCGKWELLIAECLCSSFYRSALVLQVFNLLINLKKSEKKGSWLWWLWHCQLSTSVKMSVRTWGIYWERQPAGRQTLPSDYLSSELFGVRRPFAKAPSCFLEMLWFGRQFFRD